MMERQTAYSDANINPYAAAQMQQFSAQRMQQNQGNSYSARVDSFGVEEERPYPSSARAEGQWQWERDTEPMSPELYREGQGGSASRSSYQHQGGETKVGSSQDPRALSQEGDTTAGAQDNPASLSFQALEKKFADDIMKVAKEHMDAEDAENTRHRERILAINNEYQQNLEALRARHAARREEFLRRESQARFQQYQLAGRAANHSNSSPFRTSAGFGGVGAGAPVAAVPVEAQRPFGGTGQFDSYRQQRPSENYGRGRVHGRGGGSGRVPHSTGRVYDTGPRYY